MIGYGANSPQTLTYFRPRTWRCTGLLYDGGEIGSILSLGERIHKLSAWATVPGTAGTTRIQLLSGVTVLGTLLLPATTPASTPVEIPLDVAPVGVVTCKVTQLATGQHGLTIALTRGT